MKRKLDITNCSDDTAKLMPVVNFNNCGGKDDCVEVCPYDVFEMRPISDEDKAKLNLKGKLKTIFFKQKLRLSIQTNAMLVGFVCRLVLIKP